MYRIALLQDRGEESVLLVNEDPVIAKSELWVIVIRGTENVTWTVVES